MLHAAIRWWTATCALLLAIAIGGTGLPGTAMVVSTPATAAVVPPSASDSGDRVPRRTAVPPTDRPPQSSSTKHLRESYAESTDAASIAADCAAADFTSLTGPALVSKIKSSPVACINTLFSATGNDAFRLFREAQMITVATALRDNAVTYPGDNLTSTAQLVLYLRAGYYVHWYQPSVVGPYGAGLSSAIRAGLDAFFGNPRSGTVSDANGQVLAEAITLIDSAEENARYLFMVKRMLDGYTSSYDGYYWMKTAVNNVYTVLFRGHQNAPFVAAVQSDPRVLDTLHRFALGHLNLLGTDRAYLTSNAGRELARFLRHASLLTKTRGLARGLLDRSSISGVTAPLWVGVAEMTDAYDQAYCACYGTCDLQNRWPRRSCRSTTPAARRSGSGRNR